MEVGQLSNRVLREIGKDLQSPPLVWDFGALSSFTECDVGADVRRGVDVSNIMIKPVNSACVFIEADLQLGLCLRAEGF